MFTNARLFTIDKFTNARFDCTIKICSTGGPRIARIFGGKKTPCYAKPCYAGTTLVLNY